MHSQHCLVPALMCGVMLGCAASSHAADPVSDARTLAATANKDWYKQYTKVKGEFSRRMAARLVLTAKTPLEKLMQAEAYRYFKRYDESWKIYNELSDQFPNSAMLHCHIAMAFIEAGNFKTAELKVAAAERADPESAYVFAARGALLQAQEQRKAAFEQYTDALRRNPYIYGLRGRRVLLAWLKEPGEQVRSHTTPLVPQFRNGKWYDEFEYSIVEDPRLSAGFPWRLPNDNPKVKKGDEDDFRRTCQLLSRGNVLDGIEMLGNVAERGWNGPIGDRRGIAHLAIGDYDADPGRLSSARLEGGVRWIDGKLPYDSYSDYLTAEWRYKSDAPRIKQLIREGHWDRGFLHTPTYAQMFDKNLVGYKNAIAKVLTPFTEKDFPAYKKPFAEDELRLAWETGVSAEAAWHQAHKPKKSTDKPVKPTYKGTEPARRHLMLAAQTPSIVSSDPIMKGYHLLDPAELSKSAPSLQFLAPVQLRHFRTLQHFRHELQVGYDKQMLALYKEILRRYYFVPGRTRTESTKELLDEFIKKAGGGPVYVYAGHFAMGCYYESIDPVKAKFHFAKAATTLKRWDCRQVDEQALLAFGQGEELAHWDWDPVSRARWNIIDAKQKKLKELPKVPRIGPLLDRTHVIREAIALEPEPTAEEKQVDELRLCECASCRLFRVKLLLPYVDLMPAPTGFAQTHWWLTVEKADGTELWSLYVDDDKNVLVYGVRGEKFRAFGYCTSKDETDIQVLFSKSARKLDGRLIDDNTLQGTGQDADGKPIRWVAYRIIKPAQPPRGPGKEDLDGGKFAGTTWKLYQTLGGDVTYTFKDDHTFEEVGKREPLNASRWVSFKPSPIRFSINNGFITYEGFLLDDNTMMGSVGNESSCWNWFAVREGTEIKVAKLVPKPVISTPKTTPKSEPRPTPKPEPKPGSIGKPEPHPELRPIEKNADVAGLAGSRWWVTLERLDEISTYEFTLNDDYTAAVSRTSWHNGSQWTSESADDVRISLMGDRLRLEGRLVEANTIKGFGKDSGRPLTWIARRILRVKETPVAPSKKPVDVGKLSDTVWMVYTPGGDPFTYMFRPDNTLAKSDGRQVAKSRWSSPSKQLVRFSLNDDVVKYEGKLVDENTIIGTAGNGQIGWSWMAVRQEPVSLPRPKPEPKPETTPLPVADVAGLADSKWWVTLKTSRETDTYVFTLNKDHTTTVRRTSWHDGSQWTSDSAKQIHISLFEGKQQLEGRMIAENSIDGSGQDRYGKPLTWMAQRIVDAKETPPAPSKEPKDMARLSGSVWKIYKASGSPATYKFSGDNTLATSDGKLLNRSRWSSSAEKLVRFSLNGDYVMYEGKLVNDHTIVGTAGNGRSAWSWMALRQPSE